MLVTSNIDKLKSKFTKVPNEYLRDPNLSLQAKGLLAQLLSFSSDWNLSLAGLTKISKDGRTAISNTLKELEKAGYLKRLSKRGEDGRFRTCEYALSMSIDSDIQETQTRDFYCEDVHKQNIPEVEEVLYDDTMVQDTSCTSVDYQTPVVEEQVIHSPVDRMQVSRMRLDRTAETDYNKDYHNNNIKYNTSVYKYHQSSIGSSIYDDRGATDEYTECDNIHDRIQYDTLRSRYDVVMVDTITNLISDTIHYQKNGEMIGGMFIPAEKIKKTFMTLDYDSVSDVLDAVQNRSTNVTNLRRYLLTCLYTKAETAEAEASMWVHNSFS